MHAATRLTTGDRPLLSEPPQELGSEDRVDGNGDYVVALITGCATCAARSASLEICVTLVNENGRTAACQTYLDSVYYKEATLLITVSRGPPSRPLQPVETRRGRNQRPVCAYMHPTDKGLRRKGQEGQVCLTSFRAGRQLRSLEVEAA